ncbi:TnsA endonuclease N-terminal domain-containing protein [Stenotrophomonas maltophilia]|uniref:TnsA endonuclease N-terminal domain-containing protein n=1 Tax=Stenotrophomonas maltophilia TaxID=40324 RepID=UPI001DB6BD83|nr:TnsA endonuclease N-terminal domain-containing protein [Stenotrophomonas maltophilia]MBN4998738.1 DEAD/DEAH box helicase family protein [Stenotrophomonas maltophilia]MBN5007278.1 DEAD/DEAH box helicase family protein [Stenotrophomonas maltophilia]MDH0072585.1 DEAD/DEAH box helicase family protein [Stenotrophomonas maltophilia]MDH0105628.1 DEAD/DEAH box helicase family protein [Stenotrophomonas maltophilia]MDH0331198.1 DEAD/DEAH box helicase family protein [Stenotrophomonas maltophilia]
MATKRANTKSSGSATSSVSASLDFAFFRFLWQFHQDNRGKLRQSYRELTRKYLDFNNPDKNPKAFLRQPQFEALETYVFLKEFLGNAKVEDVFKSWYERSGKFEGRKFGSFLGTAGQEMLQFGESDELELNSYKLLFEKMRKNSRTYPNYIFALTMGTGKTILMATCVFYEFLLANKFPKDLNYCHNALVFAPDKTVLQSLKEIEAFDLTRVVPPEYVNFLTTHLRFHYLEEAGTSLDTLDHSRFNIIVSNTQKIILKRQHKEKTSVDKLFGATGETLAATGVYADAADLYNFDQPEEEGELTTNQRFEKLRRLEQLGIYVDEAHHAFGKALAKDMGVGAKETDTSLRTTIDILAASLSAAGTRVVACYNYTGTPYVGREVLPEVVYAYGLKEAVDKGFLKKVTLHGYANTRTDEFVDVAIETFLRETGGIRPEGLSPKLAFFASTVEELTGELKPAVERALLKHGIPTSRILVNVGDSKVTTNDDIREFNRLDTVGSGKQFILLVNKGREGWNCRSLFGVGLFREPKSRVFVLQATMRCLRAIGEAQYTGHVFLSEDNLKTLNEELQQNFRISADELQSTGKDRERVEVRVTEPPVKIKLVRVRKLFQMREKQPVQGQELMPERSARESWNELVEKYRLIETQQDGLTAADAARASGSRTFDLTARRVKRTFSPMMLVAEVSRYLNRSPLEIEALLDATKEGASELVAITNEFNELLYDEIIPRLFRLLFDLDEYEKKDEYEVDLIKMPPKGYYEVSAAKDKIVRIGDTQIKDEERVKSFHLDTYCFDSGSENWLFWDLLREERVKKIYFTGMLTHGQSDFFIQYIDPASRTVRSYYPDFIFQREEPDGSLKYVIVEVKADNQIEDAVVQAKKEFAQQIAVASGMEYRIMKSTDADKRSFRMLL